MNKYQLIAYELCKVFSFGIGPCFTGGAETALAVAFENFDNPAKLSAVKEGLQGRTVELSSAEYVAQKLSEIARLGTLMTFCNHNVQEAATAIRDLRNKADRLETETASLNRLVGLLKSDIRASGDEIKDRDSKISVLQDRLLNIAHEAGK